MSSFWVETHHWYNLSQKTKLSINYMFFQHKVTWHIHITFFLYMQLTDDFCKAISDITSVFHCNPAVMCDIHKLLISWTLMFSCSPLAKELQTLLKWILRSHMRLPFTRIFHPWKNSVPWHQFFSFNGTRSIALQHRFSNNAVVTSSHILEWSFYWKIMPNKERARDEVWKGIYRALWTLWICDHDNIFDKK